MKTIHYLFLLGCFLLSPITYAEEERADLSWIQSWAYVLQEPNVDEIAGKEIDLVVIDYSFNGDDEGAFTKAKIKKLQDSGKLVLAYFSIGEAEDYRFYWKKNWKEANPRFIGAENPDWGGNYKVKYWNKRWWQKAMKPYLDRIIAAGFDGIYLDIIDAYYYWGEEVGNNLTGRANQMVKLVEKMAKYARNKTDSTFAVCPQNGISILDDSSAKWRKRYLATIDCIGMEDVYYNSYSNEDKNYRLKKMAELNAVGKLILNVEYVEEDQQDDYYNTWTKSGMHLVGYPADPSRDLDRLIEY